MAATPRAVLADLPKGHELPATTFTLTREELARYLDAVGDDTPIYLERGLAPPLAAAARALGALLSVLELSAGTLHTGQEVDTHGGVPIDTELTLSGRIAQRSERAGLVISILEFELTPEGAKTPALTGRTTVAAQGA